MTLPFDRKERVAQAHHRLSAIPKQWKAQAPTYPQIGEGAQPAEAYARFTPGNSNP
jgi:hypothetical protein